MDLLIILSPVNFVFVALSRRYDLKFTDVAALKVLSVFPTELKVPNNVFSF